MQGAKLFGDREDFRKWLLEHHASSGEVWVVFGKQAAISALKADAALLEALCFGWIDGQIKRVDETRYVKRFSPRRKGSRWSQRNRKLAEQLIADGDMTESGLQAIERAKLDGTWETPERVLASAKDVEAFAQRLRGVEPAYSNFQAMAPSMQRTYTMHFLDAKREDTKQRRLAQIVTRLNENKPPM